jgi:hypothetical protein
MITLFVLELLYSDIYVSALIPMVFIPTGQSAPQTRQGIAIDLQLSFQLLHFYYLSSITSMPTIRNLG